MNHFLFIIYLLLIGLISFCACFSKFDDDDYSEFNHNYPDPHLDIQRNVKIKIPSPDDVFKKDHFKFDTFKDDYFMKNNDIKLGDEFKNDIPKSVDQNQLPSPSSSTAPKTDNYKPKIIVLKKKEPKYDAFNKSDSFVNEFNTNFNSNFDEFGRMPMDFDFQSHDPWFDHHKDFDIPRQDRITTDEKLIHDYRQPTPRTPFRLPMPVPAFYPHPFPILPTPFLPVPMNRPQPQQPQQQPNQQQQNSNRPQRPSNVQQQQPPLQPPAGFYYPYYPIMPVMPHSIPNSIPNTQQPQTNSQNANVQLQHALSNMMNRNSFLGFVDPLIIVAIIAIPVIAMLGFSSVIMPFIPVIIYVLNIFFPVSAAAGRKRKRRKRSTVSIDDFCLLLNLINSLNSAASADSKLNLVKDLVENDRKVQLLYASSKLNELEILRGLHRSICKFNS